VANLPSASEHKQLAEYAKRVAASGYYSMTFKNADQIFAVMLLGYEHGFGPIASLRAINAIQGQLSLGSEAELARVYARYPDAPIDFVEMTSEVCVISAARPGRKQQRFSFSMADASTAGLLKIWDKKKEGWKDNPNWKKNPRALLRARCIGEVVGTLFPELTTGLALDDKPPRNDEVKIEVEADDASENKKNLRAEVVSLIKEKMIDSGKLKTYCAQVFNKNSLADMEVVELETLIKDLNGDYCHETVAKRVAEDPSPDNSPPPSRVMEAFERAKRGEPVVFSEPGKDITAPKSDEEEEEKELINYAQKAINKEM